MRSFPASKRRLLAALACLTLTAGSRAVTIVECEGPDGERSFMAACPPDHRAVGKRNVRPATPASEAPERPAVTLYEVVDCTACDLVRIELERHGVTATTVNLAADPDAQATVMDAVGSLSAPITRLGERFITGYDRETLSAALEEAGYSAAPQ